MGTEIVFNRWYTPTNAREIRVRPEIVAFKSWSVLKACIVNNMQTTTCGQRRARRPHLWDTSLICQQVTAEGLVPKKYSRTR